MEETNPLIPVNLGASLLFRLIMNSEGPGKPAGLAVARAALVVVPARLALGLDYGDIITQDLVDIRLLVDN